MCKKGPVFHLYCWAAFWAEAPMETNSCRTQGESGRLSTLVCLSVRLCILHSPPLVKPLRPKSKTSLLGLKSAISGPKLARQEQ